VSDPSGVTIETGALFGIGPRLGVTPDAVIEAVQPVLGAPDHDTGWLDGNDIGVGNVIETCGLNDDREIVRGDLVTGFWGTGSRTVLLYWYVGDRRVVGLNTVDAQFPPSTTGSGLTTEHGVGIGDAIDAIPDRFNIVRRAWALADSRTGETFDRTLVMARSANPAATGLEPSVRGGQYLAIDGRVVAFGSEAPEC
jgi:hypothetical protein